jgi:hypothetical protein
MKSFPAHVRTQLIKFRKQSSTLTSTRIGLGVARDLLVDRVKNVDHELCLHNLGFLF